MSDIRAEIYSQYKILIYNYFYKATLNSYTAEELTGDTFLKAFRYFNSFRGQSSVKTWLFTIARNILIDYLKQNTIEEDIDCCRLVDKIDEFSKHDEKMIINEVLSKLTEEERTLIILRDINGFTYVEIAKVLNYSEGKVKIGLHRARKKFKELYKDEYREG